MCVRAQGKFDLVRSVGEECVTDAELAMLMARKPDSFVLYDGFEPSGRMHIAQVSHAGGGWRLAGPPRESSEQKLPHATHASPRRLAPFLGAHTAPRLDRGGGVVGRVLRAAGRVHTHSERD